MANMQLVERAIEAHIDADPMKIVQLSKRHSELVAELIAVSTAGAAPAEKEDGFDQFFGSRGSPGGATAAPRK